MPDEGELELDTLRSGDALGPTIDARGAGDPRGDLPVLSRDLYQVEGEFARGGMGHAGALALQREGLDIMRGPHGEHLDVAAALSTYAAALEGNGDFAAAEPVFQERGGAGARCRRATG